MKICSARNLMMFNFTGLSFLAHVTERHGWAGWVPILAGSPDGDPSRLMPRFGSPHGCLQVGQR
jgi:hypothetical protein